MNVGEDVIVIGYGYWGKRVTNEYLKILESDKIKNIYIYEKEQELLLFKDRRIKILENLTQIPSNVRFAHVCTPNNTHFEITKQLLESGCSVLVEKPLSENSSEAEKLIEIAENNGVDLNVGMVYRYSQAVEKSRVLINNNLGSPIFISASWLHNINIPNIKRVMMERDVIWDIFIHLLDITNYIYNSWPLFEYGSGIRLSGRQNHTFISSGKLNEASIVMRSSFVSHFKERKIEIIGENADLVLDILNNVVTVGTDENRTEFHFYDNPLYSEILAFINSENHGILPNSGKIGLIETKIIQDLLKQQNSLDSEISEKR